MALELPSLVSQLFLFLCHSTDNLIEHTLLVTEDGVEILTARLPDSPGGPVPMPGVSNGETAVPA
jgi:hypothetical protein